MLGSCFNDSPQLGADGLPLRIERVNGTLGLAYPDINVLDTALDAEGTQSLHLTFWSTAISSMRFLASAMLVSSVFIFSTFDVSSIRRVCKECSSLSVEMTLLFMRLLSAVRWFFSRSSKRLRTVSKSPWRERQ